MCAVLRVQIAAGAAGLPIWARLPLSLIVGEIGFYWGHRLRLETPLLWRFHAIHHWRHARADRRDRNYASMLPFMDRIFGTVYLPKSWPAEYGVDAPPPENLVDQLLFPFSANAAADSRSG